MNIANLLHKAGRSFGERCAIAIGADRYCSYSELSQRVAIMAGQFQRRLGLQAGDRVAIAMQNCPAYLEVLFAGFHAGLCVVPVNARLHQREFHYILEHCGVRYCFVTPDLEPTIAPLCDSIPTLNAVICAPGEDYQHLFEGEAAAVELCAADAVAWLFYTSGTTGRPKGAMLSHRNLMAMTLNYLSDVDTIAPEDCIVHAAAMSHGSGLYSLPHVAKAAKHVIPASGKFDSDEIVDLVARHHGVSFFAAPTMVKRLVDCPRGQWSPCDNLKTIIYGGGHMYLAELKQSMACFGNKLVQIYGQGESPMTITVLSKADHAHVDHPRHEMRLSSVGIPQSGVDIQIVDADDNSVATDHVGEVLVRGDVVTTGFWRDPDATADRLRGGWLHTGDMGSLDSDGYLTLKDRSNDLIISGGSNIYPREVEEALLFHGGVQEASVIGRLHPDWGEEVVAFIVRKSGQLVSEVELDATCQANIARYKRPRAYFFVDQLPKNNYGKVLKTALRETLESSPCAQHGNHSK